MTDGSSRELTFYPALYFDASPTYNAWVKLTVAAVHCLESRKGFEGKYDVLGRRYHAYLQTGQGIYFYGNHPISFVVVAGMVVDFEPNSVYWLFHIDDGSGSLVEVVLPRPRESPRALASPGQPIGPISPATVGISGYGSRIDVGGIEVGKCVKVSGTIREFRGIKQVSLEKLAYLHDTAAEVVVWDKAVAQFNDILSKSWVLSQTDRMTMERKARKAMKAPRDTAIKGSR